MIMAESPWGAAPAQTDFIVTTTNGIDGRPVQRYHGVVTGEVIVGANLFRDLFASVRDEYSGFVINLGDSGRVTLRNPLLLSKEERKSLSGLQKRLAGSGAPEVNEEALEGESPEETASRVADEEAAAEAYAEEREEEIQVVVRDIVRLVADQPHLGAELANKIEDTGLVYHTGLIKKYLDKVKSGEA